MVDCCKTLSFEQYVLCQAETARFEIDGQAKENIACHDECRFGHRRSGVSKGADILVHTPRFLNRSGDIKASSWWVFLPPRLYRRRPCRVIERILRSFLPVSSDREESHWSGSSSRTHHGRHGLLFGGIESSGRRDHGVATATAALGVDKRLRPIM